MGKPPAVGIFLCFGDARHGYGVSFRLHVNGDVFGRYRFRNAKVERDLFKRCEIILQFVQLVENNLGRLGVDFELGRVGFQNEVVARGIPQSGQKVGRVGVINAVNAVGGLIRQLGSVHPVGFAVRRSRQLQFFVLIVGGGRHQFFRADVQGIPFENGLRQLYLVTDRLA